MPDPVTRQLPVASLHEGLYVDLQGDAFADDADVPNVLFEYEYQRVSAVEVETPGCTCVYLEGGYACGFPPDHLVTVVDVNDTSK